MQLKNDLLLRTIRGEKTERTPVWLMRQAGRILPEYRAVREKMKGFVELVKDPERAAEVTIQPVDLLGVDAAIIFSDILVIPEAMGLPYEMVEKKGPYFPKTVNSASDINQLKVADISGDLAYTPEAIKVTKRELNGRVPIIGFAGAPWTIFAYMVEGAGSKTFSKPRAMLYKEPELAHRLLQMITDSTIAYLKAQIEAGADLVQVFDSWAGILSTKQYADFSLYYISRICDAITEVPVTVFAKGAFTSMPAMPRLSCETIGLDWNVDIPQMRSLFGETKVLQGNLDPATLYADYSVIEQETKRMLEAFGPYRHIANLGHGVYPDINPEKVKRFIEVVKEYSAEMRTLA
ncbi:uroporphyrinogen decarboxylase [Catalinimonas alkaloidigena]|uniref:uroporphyrinogen decarboxylase n=1 Tax=Catalinimonas alkaloidigena TaxID=1075417 RepID=UPI002406D4CD|nr:uroporphyrinogen decarboxylase [Catalinimonas alkaloidigena]MDF9799445.1 uroporphyrinogen decarboxylase [Catalinimonas alkaloidigena]